MNGPDLLLPSPVQAAPMPEVRNHTPYPSQYYQMLDVDDEVFHVLVSRLSYDLRRLDAQGAPQLAAQQTPLVLADQFYGQANLSSCIQESDLAPYKPKCDVLLTHAVAHAPDGRAQRRWPVGLRIGSWEKIIQVTGARLLERSAQGWTLTEPEPAQSVPLRWEHAFGGSRRWPLQQQAGQEPELEAHFEANPIGCGWADPAWLNKSRVADLDAPQIEAWRRLFDAKAAARMDYPPAGVGVVGRWWSPRRQKAGTYDQTWRETRWPRLPLDFDFGYWNCAPEDQQIEHPQGGEEVQLAGLVPGGGVLRFLLPAVAPEARVRLHAGPILPRAMKLDTIVIDLKAMTLSCVHRMTLAARMQVRMLEIVQ